MTLEEDINKTRKKLKRTKFKKERKFKMKSWMWGAASIVFIGSTIGISSWLNNNYFPCKQTVASQDNTQVVASVIEDTLKVEQPTLIDNLTKEFTPTIDRKSSDPLIADLLKRKANEYSSLPRGKKYAFNEENIVDMFTDHQGAIYALSGERPYRPSELYLKKLTVTSNEIIVRSMNILGKRIASNEIYFGGFDKFGNGYFYTHLKDIKGQGISKHYIQIEKLRFDSVGKIVNREKAGLIKFSNNPKTISLQGAYCDIEGNHYLAIGLTRPGHNDRGILEIDGKNLDLTALRGQDEVIISDLHSKTSNQFIKLPNKVNSRYHFRGWLESGGGGTKRFETYDGEFLMCPSGGASFNVFNESMERIFAHDYNSNYYAKDSRNRIIEIKHCHRFVISPYDNFYGLRRNYPLIRVITMKKDTKWWPYLVETIRNYVDDERLVSFKDLRVGVADNNHLYVIEPGFLHKINIKK